MDGDVLWRIVASSICNLLITKEGVPAPLVAIRTLDGIGKRVSICGPWQEHEQGMPVPLVANN